MLELTVIVASHSPKPSSNLRCGRSLVPDGYNVASTKLAATEGKMRAEQGMACGDSGEVHPCLHAAPMFLQQARVHASARRGGAVLSELL